MYNTINKRLNHTMRRGTALWPFGGCMLLLLFALLLKATPSFGQGTGLSLDNIESDGAIGNTVGAGGENTVLDAFQFEVGPAPTAASLGTFGGQSIGLSSGTPEVNVPLTALKEAGFELPITLSYSSSGLKVSQVSSWVGLGWSLQAGGAITRTIRGREDEMDTYGFLDNYSSGPKVYQFNSDDAANSLNPNANNADSYIASNLLIGDLNANVIDFQPDLFSFNFGDYSGKFVLDGNGVPRFLPHADLKIEVPSGHDWSAAVWYITTPDGVKYTFGGAGAVETTQTKTLDAGLVQQYPQLPTAWYLTQIDIPGGGQINFTYASHEIRHNLVFQETEFQYVTGGANEWCVFPDNRTKYFDHLTQGVHLTGISTSSQLVEVTSANDRQDVVGPTNLPGGARFTGLLVKQKSSGTRLMRVALDQDYWVSPQGNVTYRRLASASNTALNNATHYKYRLRLNEVKLYGRTDVDPKTYAFDYVNDPNESMPPRSSPAQDYWGYYNGKTLSTTLVPNLETLGHTFSGYADRSPSFDHAVLGMLEKVTYPTGGYTEFTYVGRAEENGGGVLVSKEQDVPVTGLAVTREYTYEDPFDIVAFNPYAWISTIDFYVNDVESPACQMYQLSNTTEPGGNDAVMFGKVTVKQTDNAGNALGRTEHYFRKASDLGFQRNPSLPRINRGWRRGMETAVKVYDSNGTLLEETAHSYTMRHVATVRGWNMSQVQAIPAAGAMSNHLNTRFYANYYNIFSEFVDKTSTTVTKYDDNGNAFTQTTSYVNNAAHAVPETVTTTGSAGESITQEFTYAWQLDIPSADILENAHMVATPMVTSKKIDGKVVNSTFVDYLLGSDGFPHVKTAYVLKASAPQTNVALPSFNTSSNELVLDSRYYLHSQYDAYDGQGRPRQLSPRDGITKTIIWGSNRQIPIAVALGAQANEVAFTDFEGFVGGATAEGGWSLSSGALFTSTGHKHTGKKSLSSTGSTSFETSVNVPHAKKFRVGFWAKPTGAANSGTISLDGHGLSYTTASTNWQYFEWVVTLPANTTRVEVDFNGVYVDGLRLQPALSSITTQTIEEGVGILDRCDNKGMPTYYEYDDFNRLLLVRDHEGNIIKKLEYAYQISEQ